MTVKRQVLMAKSQGGAADESLGRQAIATSSSLGAATTGASSKSWCFTLMPHIISSNPWVLDMLIFLALLSTTSINQHWLPWHQEGMVQKWGMPWAHGMPNDAPPTTWTKSCKSATDGRRFDSWVFSASRRTNSPHQSTSIARCKRQDQIYI